jgi:hypothetical protein
VRLREDPIALPARDEPGNTPQDNLLQIVLCLSRDFFLYVFAQAGTRIFKRVQRSRRSSHVSGERRLP